MPETRKILSLPYLPGDAAYALIESQIVPVDVIRVTAAFGAAAPRFRAAADPEPWDEDPNPRELEREFLACGPEARHAPESYLYSSAEAAAAYVLEYYRMRFGAKTEEHGTAE
ncbi:MAG: hypothetical protein NW241_10945 [Bacteroidia bacterium]|nr:hypothetical protein [Bacteroidia bacterium]